MSLTVNSTLSMVPIEIRKDNKRFIVEDRILVSSMKCLRYVLRQSL